MMTPPRALLSALTDAPVLGASPLLSLTAALVAVLALLGVVRWLTGDRLVVRRRATRR